MATEYRYDFLIAPVFLAHWIARHSNWTMLGRGSDITARRRTERYGFQFPVEERDFSLVRNFRVDYGAQPVFYAMGVPLVEVTGA
jgi:hypothetical protein